MVPQQMATVSPQAWGAGYSHAMLTHHAAADTGMPYSGSYSRLTDTTHGEQNPGVLFHGCFEATVRRLGKVGRAPAGFGKARGPMIGMGVVGLRQRRLGQAAGLMMAIVIGFGVPAVMAQDKKAAPAAKAAPQAAAAAQPQGEPVMWVKLCEKAPLVTKDKDGKEARAEKSICLTHHERLDGNTGMVLVSAAVRQIEGMDKQHLMIMVPLGMAIQPGLRATVYNKELWEKAQRNEKVDDAKLSPIKLSFALCHPAGCTAELEVTKEIMDQLRGGAGIMVFAINANGQVIAFPVPLAGFPTAIDGPPADNKVYTEERRRLMQELAARQQQQMEEMKKQQQQQGGQQQPSSAPAAAPAEKKK